MRVKSHESIAIFQKLYFQTSIYDFARQRVYSLLRPRRSIPAEMEFHLLYPLEPGSIRWNCWNTKREDFVGGSGVGVSRSCYSDDAQRREQSHLYFSTLSRQFGTIRIGIKPEASKNIFTTTWAYNWQTILQSFDLAKSFTARVQIFAWKCMNV